MYIQSSSKIDLFFIIPHQYFIYECRSPIASSSCGDDYNSNCYHYNEARCIPEGSRGCTHRAGKRITNEAERDEGHRHGIKAFAPRRKARIIIGRANNHWINWDAHPEISRLEADGSPQGFCYATVKFDAVVSSVIFEELWYSIYLVPETGSFIIEMVRLSIY